MYGPDFIRRYAPSLSFVDRGNDQGGAGLDINHQVSEEVDLNTGTPLPFISSGGQRTYYSDQGELRGRAAPMVGMYDSPTATAPEAGIPQDGPVSLRPPTTGLDNYIEPGIGYSSGALPPPSMQVEPPPIEQQRRIPGMSPTIPLPRQSEPPSVEEQRRQNISRSATIPPGNGNSGLDSYVPPGLQYQSGTMPPPQDLLRGRTQEGGRRQTFGSPIDPERLPPRLRREPPIGGNDQRMATLGNLLDQFNTVFSRDNGNAGPAIRGRLTTQPDPNRALGTVGDISSYPDFGSETGLADFNARFARAAQEMGVNNYRPIGPQGRSQERQNEFMEEYRQGRRSTRPATNSYHVNQVGGAFRAADIQPHRLGGLRGPANEGRVRDILTRAGYPSDIEVVWENNPPHYHIEPPPRFNPGRRQQQ